LLEKLLFWTLYSSQHPEHISKRSPLNSTQDPVSQLYIFVLLDMWKILEIMNFKNPKKKFLCFLSRLTTVLWLSVKTVNVQTCSFVKKNLCKFIHSFMSYWISNFWLILLGHLRVLLTKPPPDLLSVCLSNEQKSILLEIKRKTL